MSRNLSLLSVALCGALLFSCVSQKKIVYFQQKSDTTNAIPFDTTFITVIHPNDILNIFVTSTNIEASQYFNFSDRPELMASANPSSPGANGYLVDAYGFIQFPLVGAVKVGGLTSHAAHDTIVQLLSKYIGTPTVKLNIQNFKVTVLGEVNRPSIYYVSSEKMTLPDALSLAGDMTLYGNRENVMVIREENGKKSFQTVNFTSRDFFSSPYYNLHSNDIVYVEPIRGKKFQIENWYKILPIFLSTVSVAMVFVGIFKK
ncbi:MAG: polysaccharide biosynthesis/export family protein [Bacteroidetes bacterium]|nr:polysaccharide biosynthesis/export family protein [Bacteroidota bacterium]